LRHIFPSDRIAGLCNAEQGLSASEVERRRKLYGNNDIIGDRVTGWSAIARDTALDPMVWFLAATATLFAWLGDYAEAAVLGLALLPIAGMDAYLHRRTYASTEGLAGRLAAFAHVFRDGSTEDRPSADLVAGDLVLVKQGEAFPADGLLVAGTDMQVDESVLTGEALPVRKRSFAGPLMQGSTAVDDENWGAAGARLLTGEARLRVGFTGGETLYGEIVRSAREGRHERTPLQRAIGSLVTQLVVVSVLVCVALAATRYCQGFGLLDAFLSAVTLAVAALPEEFPVAFTFFLALGVYRLAHRQALVRRAVVVENIGRVTCICADKTGTLTEGKLKLAHVLPAHDPEELHQAAAFSSRAASGDPIDIAILDTVTTPGATVLATFPFTEDRRRETSIVRDQNGDLLAAVKGAPETVLAMTELPEAEKGGWLAKTHELGGTGHKVLACARKRLSASSGDEPEQGYEFLGLLAFEDPVRYGVRQAVATAQAAGIRVIMVTGDHVATAGAIAREIGLGTGDPRIIEGCELASRLGETCNGFDVVARAMPSQKLDLVRFLRAQGEIVAVTGDGVNDVPALQGADIGIAMGERGTRTARDVASIVLLDDNFRTIVRAISEGRQLFRNLKLSFAYLLLVHMPLVATAALIPFAGFPLLYLPIHVVWLELIIHPTALLVFQDLPPSGRLEPVERSAKLRFFDWREWTLIVFIGLLVSALIVMGYIRSLGGNHDVEHARSMALVALIVASATMTAGLTRLRSKASIVAVFATVGSALVLVQVPQFAALLHLSSLHFDDWLIAALGGGTVGALAGLLPILSRSSPPPLTPARV
jgi:Ca2+-transporting ATPase